MKREKAIEILTKQNEWRRDNSVPSKNEMQDPKELGEAIDYAIELMKKNDYEKYINNEHDDIIKSYLGAIDIGDMINEYTEKFDRRKFGKLTCPFCFHKFNPFYLKKFNFEEEGEWVSRGEYKEPEEQIICNCPKCKKELFFKIYIGQ